MGGLRGSCPGVGGHVYSVASVAIEVRLASEGDGACVAASGDTVVIRLPEQLIEADVEASVFAEAVAGLLLVEPSRRWGDTGPLEVLAARYARRVAAEEARRLRSRLGLLSQHVLAADIGPLVARLSRLFRIHIWSRPLYAAAPTASAKRLRRLAREGYATRPWMRLDELPEPPEQPGLRRRFTLAAKAAREAASVSLLQGIPAELLLRGLSTRPPPPLRDPLLYFRLDAAKLATKLLSFEEQLYALIGVRRALMRRSSPIRSASIVEAGDHRPAVVKHYRASSLAKWLLVAAASTRLPRPRTRPAARLQAEYHYNRVLDSAGFNVPQPILVDPRRLRAAYSYIEGATLADLVREDPVTPFYRSYGSLLARLHAENIALWDSNPTNVVVAGDGSLYLVDLEQARDNASTEEKAMDIAVAIYYSAPYSMSRVDERAALLATGYLEAGGQPGVLLEAAKYKYMAPFIAAAPAHLLERARHRLLEAAKQGA